MTGFKVNKYSGKEQMEMLFTKLISLAKPCSCKKKRNPRDRKYMDATAGLIIVYIMFPGHPSRKISCVVRVSRNGQRV